MIGDALEMIGFAVFIVLLFLFGCHWVIGLAESLVR